MKTLYKEQGSQFRIELLETPKMQEFIETHADSLNSGFQQVKMSDAMRQRLQRSNYIFSGMKTFHELNEAFPSLIDENGNRKPFEQFLNDVQKIDRTYNQDYLRAEYNFCQASADMAAKWKASCRQRRSLHTNRTSIATCDTPTRYLQPSRCTLWAGKWQQSFWMKVVT